MGILTYTAAYRIRKMQANMATTQVWDTQWSLSGQTQAAQTANLSESIVPTCIHNTCPPTLLFS